VKIYDDLTPALQSILLQWIHGYTCWTVTDPLPRAKAEAVLAKWAELYGTNLPAWKRQDRKEKGLPNAVALAAPVVGLSGRFQLVLMATAPALSAPTVSPFSREKWKTRCPEFAEYVIVHEPRDRGDYAWTWRLQEKVVAGLENQLISIIGRIDAVEVRRQTFQWVGVYVLFGGVRRQLRRILRSSQKLWARKHKTVWPGPDPDKLPAMVGFRSAKSKSLQSSSACGH
jgi:hypothetical protein